MSSLKTLPGASIDSRANAPLIGQEDGRAQRKKSCKDELASRNRTMNYVRLLVASFIAELAGSFFIGLIGSGAQDLAIAGGLPPLHPYMIGIAFTAIIFPLALGLEQFNSGQFNPSVTIGLALMDRDITDWRRIVRYVLAMVAQLVGYILSALFVQWIIGGGSIANMLTIPSIGLVRTTVFESLWVFAIVLLILVTRNVAIKSLSVATLFGIAIGQCALLTGGSFNLFRSLGPAIVEGVYTNIWVYIIANIVGPILAVVVRLTLLNYGSAASRAGPIVQGAKRD